MFVKLLRRYFCNSSPKLILHRKLKQQVLLQFCKNWIFPNFSVQTPDQKADSPCDAVRSGFLASPAELCARSQTAGEHSGAGRERSLKKVSLGVYF